MVDLRDEVGQTVVLSTLTDSGVTVTEVALVRTARRLSRELGHPGRD
jgi:hypothetical protein